MAHRTLRSGYLQLAARLNRFPQGAPPSELLYSILQMLFSSREAELVALLPLRPFTSKMASRLWRTAEPEARLTLEELASRALLLDVEVDGQSFYTLPPPMAGFFEFSLMRCRDDIDQKLLSELFYQYLNVEEDFIKELFTAGETQLGRVFVREETLSGENALHVLDYERASEVIRTASHIGVGLCYCRHKMSHLGKACDAPMEICMTFNFSARSLIGHGHAKAIEAAECLDLLEVARERNLVQFGENVKSGVNFICNCCSCCCEAMIAARRFGMLQPVHTSNFLSEVEKEGCGGCGKCVELCPVEALTLVSANDPRSPRKMRAKVDEGLCLGCGVCVRGCPGEALRMRRREKRVLTPVDTAHRTVVMAIERGKLQNLIFDNQALLSHRAMAAVLGVILKLPPVKKALAGRQLNSRYLEALMERGTPWDVSS